jgi:hypothetical protein
MPFITQYMDPDVAWWILLVSIAVNGIANSFVQGGLFGFASVFPSSCMGVMMIGQGINGLILNIIKMILLASLPPDEEKGPDDKNSYFDSVIYLTVAICILVLCIVGYRYMMSLEFTKYHVLKSQLREDSIDGAIPLISNMDDEEHTNLLSKTRDSPNMDVDRINPSYRDSSIVDGRNRLSSSNQENATKYDVLATPRNDQLTMKELYWKIFYLSIQASIVFGITFLIYPGTLLATKFDMLDGNKSAKGWFNIIMISIFKTISILSG